MQVPAGFVKLTLQSSLYLETNGPFYIKRDAEDIWLGMRIEKRHCNSAGYAHGGMLMTFADLLLTAGSNARTELSRFLPTLNATCDFLGSALDGDWIHGRIEVLRQTRNYVFSQVLVTTLEGAPVFRASGTLLIRGEVESRYAPALYFGEQNRSPRHD
jgi:uncharacterized protein (TIGR00369 family)